MPISSGYGLYSYVAERLRGLYAREGKDLAFCSAEQVIYAFSDRKSEDDISKLRTAARRALEILEAAFSGITPGMSELELVELVHSLAEQKPSYFEDVISPPPEVRQCWAIALEDRTSSEDPS